MIGCRACLCAANASPLLRLGPPPQFALRTARRSSRPRTISAFPPTKTASLQIPPQARTHSSASAASAAPAAPAAAVTTRTTTATARRTTTSTPPQWAATSRLRQTPLHIHKTARFFSTPSSGDADASPTSSPPALDKPANLTEGESAVWDRLVSAPALDSVCQLRVQDVSGGCGSMYGIEIASAAFRGLSVLKQQRLVNAALGDMVKEWHGLQLKTSVP